MGKQITVRIVYRNYKPLHKIHESLINNPPDDVVYIVPDVLKYAGGMLKVYRKLGDNKVVRFMIKKFQQFKFSSAKETEADLLQYVNIVSEKIPDKPYIVEIEHPHGLANFTQDVKYLENTVMPFMLNDSCKAVVCMSKACKKTLIEIAGDKFSKLKPKTYVIYPAIEEQSNSQTSSKYIKSAGKIQLLFVGNDSYRKGLDELLSAIELLRIKENLEPYELHIISNDAEKIVTKHNIKDLHLYKPEFTKEEILKYFFKPADFFIMPTKLDTLGMVFIDALSTGTAVIATSQYAIPELVTNNKDGILIPYEGLLDLEPLPTREQSQKVDSAEGVDDKLTHEIYKVLKKLANSEDLRSALSNQTKDKFTGNGVLSIDARNKKLRKIYEEALK